MFLPKVIKNLGIVFLLVPLFFNSSFGLFVTKASAQETPQNTSTNQQYQITPIPPSSPGNNIVPIPTQSAGIKIQQANFFTDLMGGIGDLIGAFTGTIADWLKGALSAIVSGAVYVVEHTFLFQLAGNGADALFDQNKLCQPISMKEMQNTFSSDPLAWRSYGIAGMVSVTGGSLLDYPLPINSGQYFASINPFKSAQAETGMVTLQNNHVILDIWTNIRNGALALAVVALVIIGFMIMFRFPLGPRNFVTIQNALPRIAIALVLIVFSYAIAGLMIDIVRVFGSMFNSMLPWGTGSPSLLNNLIPFFLVSTPFIGLLAPLVCGPSALAAAAIVPVMLLFGLIFIILLIILYIMIIFKLLSRYVQFLLLTIFAPIFFLIGAIPGASGAYSFWFKRSAAALVAIPAVGFILKLALIIVTTSNTAFDFPDMMIQPLNGIFGWILFPQVIALGLLFFALKVPDIVDQAFNNIPLGGRGGKGGFGAVIAAPMGALRTVGTVTKAAPLMGAWGASMANSGGITGRIGSGVSRLFGTFNPDEIKQRTKDAEKQRVQNPVKQEVVTRTGQGPTAPSSPVQTRFSPSRGTNEEAKENPPNKG